MLTRAAPLLVALSLLLNAEVVHSKPAPGLPVGQSPGKRAAAIKTVGQSLTASEREALLAGQIISRPVHFARGVDGYYVGGVSYLLVKATPAEVMSALVDVAALPHLLPRTKRASLIESSGDRARIELVQGSGMFEASYTVHVERASTKDELRFWMDGSRPHDVKDVWGFFRVRPFGPDRTIVTVAAVLDLGPGIVRMLFEDSIQRVILSSPRNIKGYVEPRALASAR